MQETNNRNDFLSEVIETQKLCYNFFDDLYRKHAKHTN